MSSLRVAMSNAYFSKQNANDAQGDMVRAISSSDMLGLVAAAIRLQNARKIEELFQTLHEKYQKYPDCLGARLLKVVVRLQKCFDKSQRVDPV